MRALIVEDEIDLCDFIIEDFIEQGIDAEGVYNAEQAIEKVKKKNYELILTDIRLPGMDGIKMISEIKKEYQNGKKPDFFVMTGFSDYLISCLLYTSPSPRDRQKSRMPSSA